MYTPRACEPTGSTFTQNKPMYHLRAQFKRVHIHDIVFWSIVMFVFFDNIVPSAITGYVIAAYLSRYEIDDKWERSFCFSATSAAACSVARKIWSCMVDNAATYNTSCVTATDITAPSTRIQIFSLGQWSLSPKAPPTKNSSTTATTPMETNVTLHEAVHNTQCERSCLWKKVVCLYLRVCIIFLIFFNF